MSNDPARITVPKFVALKKAGRKITMLTAYDYPTARLLDAAGVEALLVGDSLAMVIQGHENTLSVTLDEMIYHAEMVGRAAEQALVVVDMPFPSGHMGVHEAIELGRADPQGNPLPGGQARRRRRAGAGDPAPGGGGHSGHGPLRTAPAERPSTGRLPRAARRTSG